MFTQGEPLSSFACRTSSFFGIVDKCQIADKCYVSKRIGQIRATMLEASSYILSCRKVAFGLSLKVFFYYFYFLFHCLLFYFLYIEIKSFLLLAPDGVNTSRNGSVILLSLRIIRCSICGP